MDVASLVDRISRTPGCSVRQPMGLPVVCEQHILPEDLKQFYRLCGGVSLSDGICDPVEIVPPSAVVLANAVQLIGLDEDGIALHKERHGILWSWYIIADYGNSNYVAIDLSQERLGRCYDADHEVYGSGNERIIANSFTDLLRWLFEDWDRRHYPKFENLGNAFD